MALIETGIPLTARTDYRDARLPIVPRGGTTQLLSQTNFSYYSIYYPKTHLQTANIYVLTAPYLSFPVPSNQQCQPIRLKTNNGDTADFQVVMPSENIAYIDTYMTGGAEYNVGGTDYPHRIYFYIPTTTTGLFYLTFDITGVGSFRTINYRVLPKIAEPKNLIWIEAVDTTYYNYSTPISVLFDAPTRYFSQENKVVKYDDERGTIIPLRQDVFDTFSFESAPMNGDIARLLQTISEWDKVAVYFKEKGVWQSVNCVKSAEAFSVSRFPNTFGCKVSGKFVVKP